MIHISSGNATINGAIIGAIIGAIGTTIGGLIVAYYTEAQKPPPMAVQMRNDLVAAANNNDRAKACRLLKSFTGVEPDGQGYFPNGISGGLRGAEKLGPDLNVVFLRKVAEDISVEAARLRAAKLILEDRYIAVIIKAIDDVCQM